MRILYICQAVDLDDPVLATTVRWIGLLAADPRVEAVDTLCIRKGRYDLPESVTVTDFGRANRARTLAAFTATIARALRYRRPDAVFIQQGGPYPMLLAPLRALGVSLYQWKAHPHIDVFTRVGSRIGPRRIFTATSVTLPLELEKVEIVGQGIDTGRFAPRPTQNRAGLVTTGRVAASKRLDVLVESVQICRDRYGDRFTLDIWGPVLDGDADYEREIAQRCRTLDLSEVTFRGGVGHDRLPELLSCADAFVSASETALDKAALEAMATATPVVSMNTSFGEALPADLAASLVPASARPEDFAETLHALMSRPADERDEIGRQLREIVVRDHSDVRLWQRIVDSIAADVAG